MSPKRDTCSTVLPRLLFNYPNKLGNFRTLQYDIKELVRIGDIYLLGRLLGIIEEQRR